MELKTTLVHAEHQKVTELSSPPYFNRIQFPKEKRYVLPPTKSAYNTGYVIGAFNCTPEHDMVIIPKIPKLDFVRMMLDLSRSDNPQITGRLHDIIHYFDQYFVPTDSKLAVETTPVNIRTVKDFDTREFLLLLFADLFIHIKENGYRTEGAEEDIIYIAEFIERNGYFHDRLTPLDISFNCLDYEPDRRTSSEQRFGSGLLAAAAKARHAITLYSQSMCVWPFLVDMPLLFELWCRSLFDGHVYYQEPLKKGKLQLWIPDIIDPSEKIVIDCKYKLHLKDNVDTDDLRQICGYGRLTEVRKLLNIFNEPNLLFLYPDKSGYSKLPDPPIWDSADLSTYITSLGFLGIRLPSISF